MPISRTYECPDCSGEFRFLHMRSDEPAPSFCALCGAYMGVDPRPLPSMPHIASGSARSPDATYRAMEEASAVRVSLAEAMLPAESGGDMGVMRVTDMKDRIDMGDTAVAASLPTSPLSASTEAVVNAQPVGMVTRRAFEGYAGAAKQGPYAVAGQAALGLTRNNHAAVAAQVTAAGRVR